MREIRQSSYVSIYSMLNILYTFGSIEEFYNGYYSIMKRTGFVILFAVIALLSGCSKYDDTDIRNQISDINGRLEKLERSYARPSPQSRFSRSPRCRSAAR